MRKRLIVSIFHYVLNEACVCFQVVLRATLALVLVCKSMVIEHFFYKKVEYLKRFSYICTLFENLEKLESI